MPEVPEVSGAAKARGKRFWLEHGRQSIELRPGIVIIGRSSGCHIVLDDAMVSRRHAQLTVGSEVVSVEDFGSVNGVYVNSRRIKGNEALRDGDHIQIGTQELVLRATLRSEAAEPVEQRFLADTLHGMQTKELAGRALPAVVTESEATFSAHTLDLLGGVAEKVLALGRGEEAEKMLSMTLGNLLGEVRAGRGNASSPHVFDKAALYAVRLADATGKGKWVDYAVELFTLLSRTLPAPVVDQLYEVLRKVSAINLPALRAYVDMLKDQTQGLGPSERFVLQRLEGLERLAALR